MARENLTAGRIAAFKCPDGKGQAFLWDKRAPGLALRVTEGNGRAYIFQSRLNGKALRITIGEPESWSIPDAQAEARRLQGLIDKGQDPRLDKAATIAREAQERATLKTGRAKRQVLGLDAWKVYCDERKSQWGPHSQRDNLTFASAGGAKRLRAKDKLTKPGPLYALLNRPLAEIDSSTVSSWIARETKTRPARAALAFRLLRAFINWCAAHSDYRAIVHADACAPKKTREKLAKPVARADALQREQLAPWFTEVRKLNPVHAAYLQALLLTGARREELLGLRWQDVDFQWKALRIRDKVEGERVIPLTPYVAQLLDFLPRRDGCPWVFSSPTAASGRLQEPRIGHNRALLAAGLPSLTLHGLRRSFGALAEWCEVPVGIVAQVMGHKPSALAEKHYRVRPLDLLRMWHERIEAWILEQAGMAAAQSADAAAPVLRVIKNSKKAI